MKTNVQLRKMDNHQRNVFNALILIHALSRKTKTLQNGANIVQGGDYHKSTINY